MRLFGQAFKAGGNNYFTQIALIVLKSIIFQVKSFLDNFYGHFFLVTLTGTQTRTQVRVGSSSSNPILTKCQIYEFLFPQKLFPSEEVGSAKRVRF